MMNDRSRIWHTGVDRFIAPTEFVKSKFVAAGFPGERIKVKGNFVGPPWSDPVPEQTRLGGLFVGRLSDEKGIKTLLRATEQSGVPLRIAGDGPLMELCNRSASVKLGRLSAKDIRNEMLAARYLVVPSEWTASNCFETRCSGGNH
jgi:glycosyltransferase involved in cell wall biosynthesis